MLFWRRKKKSDSGSRVEDKPQEKKSTKSRKSPWGQSIPLEVKLLGLDALAAGLSTHEVGELLGVWEGSVRAWRKLHCEGGIDALRRTPSAPNLKQRCAELEERIIAYRKAHPEAGVRRIRDELRQECIPVSAEKVRQVVNEAGLGNPAPQSHAREHPQRRFERSCPNSLWLMTSSVLCLARMTKSAGECHGISVALVITTASAEAP